MQPKGFSNQILMCCLENSRYLADAIFEELTEQGVHISKLNIFRDTYPNGEKYTRLEIPTPFSLIGKTAIYVGALVSDDDILDCERVGSTLAHSGVKRRIFVIPFIAYSSSDRVRNTGEVVTAKITNQMLSSLGATEEGNIFIFFDLHAAGLLHYFEGSCLRIELYGQKMLIRAIKRMSRDLSKVVIGTPNLRNTKWVNSYASELNCPIVFATDGAGTTEISGILGDVKGKHVIMYEDLVKTGKIIISAARAYLEAGAEIVDIVISHFAITDESQLKDLINSPISRIIAANTHPITQHELIKSSKKFTIVDVAPEFGRCLFEILPSDRFPRLSV